MNDNKQIKEIEYEYKSRSGICHTKCPYRTDIPPPMVGSHYCIEKCIYGLQGSEPPVQIHKDKDGNILSKTKCSYRKDTHK